MSTQITGPVLCLSLSSCRNTIVPLETNLLLDVFEPACWNLTIISRKFFSKNLAKGSMGGGVGWGLI